MMRFKLQSDWSTAVFAVVAYMVSFSICLGQATPMGTPLPPGGTGRIGIVPPAGIKIDADGVVSPPFTRDSSRKLAQKRRDAFVRDHVSDDVNRPSELRKVSLVRLEQACLEYIEKGEMPPMEMQFLAGLNRIDYIFVSPETKDLVIAGPAEGFGPDEESRIVGLKTGRPPLRLDDLIVALRALQTNQQIGCSIDPPAGNLANLQRYIARNSTATSVSAIRKRFVQMRKILGMHNITVFGIPADSHFARVLVEADYRMKLISVGLENPKVRGLPSHLSLLKPQGNSMQRWWLTPLYDAFYQSEDGNAYEITGQRTQLMSQEEQVSSSGQRSSAAFTRVTTQKFSQQFTEKYPELATRSRVFAELQNLIDLTIVAALFKKERLPEKVGWNKSLFLDRNKIVYAKMTVPQKVDAVMNYRKARRGMIMGLVGGGVSILPMATIQQAAFKTDEARRLGSKRTAALNTAPPEKHPWWWD